MEEIRILERYGATLSTTSVTVTDLSTVITSRMTWVAKE